MLHAHLEESQDRVRHQEHDLYASNVKATDLRQQMLRVTSGMAAVEEQLRQLRLRNEQQGREITQAQDLLRRFARASAQNAEDITNFLEARGA